MAPRRVADNLRNRGAGRPGVSPILATLGPEWFAAFPAVHTPGRVVWCNFELARTLGFAVPSSNRMTPRFHQQLIEALSYRAVPSGKATPRRRVTTLYADRYGGEGLGPALGSGRAGFLPFGNLCLKGVGITPLFRHDDPDDFKNSHGRLQMNHAISEALFGEVNHHLFTHGSSRMLAIIDQGGHVLYPDDGKVPIVLGVRSGTQLRPGHLLARRIRRRRSILEAFVRITTETRQLVTRRDAATGDDVPDITRTMLRVVDDHARAVAERFRWRMIHGAVTSSNMDMSGAMLDLTTQSAQPRTAPVCFRYDYGSVFGQEHLDCATELKAVYRVLFNSIAKRERRQLNASRIDFAREMRRAYAGHLQTQLLSAIGCKPEVVQRIRAEHPDLARRFARVLTAMCALGNRGDLETAKRVVDDVSVLDVFNLLREFPRRYFARPRARHARFIRQTLNPVFRGSRRQVARSRATVARLITQVDRVYRELMRVCATYAQDYYGNAAGMRASITARAAFENEPIRLYRSALYRELQQAIVTSTSTGDVARLGAMIDRQVSTSLRRVDALLAQGASRRLTNGGYEIEMRTIDGIDYSVCAWSDRRQRRLLRVSVPVTRRGRDFAVQLPGWPRLSRRRLQALRYRFTTNGWLTTQTRAARLTQHPNGRSAIVCVSIPAKPLIGRLEGVFYVQQSRGHRPGRPNVASTGYTYAVPDQHELVALTGESWPPRTR